MVTTLPWIEKYRPIKLNEIVSHNNNIRVLKKFIKNETLPHLLFHGPSGTGKTSSIMACARELYGPKYKRMILELNASDNRGIETVRTNVRRFVMTHSFFFDLNNTNKKMFKLVILDETDQMTDDAQAILRRVMEIYTKNARFCLICNYINKINPALRSRCTTFRFTPLLDKDIRKQIQYIINKESITITSDAINTIIKLANGDMRKILNIIQSASMAYTEIDKTVINKCAGYPDDIVIRKAYSMMIKLPFYKSYSNIQKIIKINGFSLVDFIKEIHYIVFSHIIETKRDKFLKKCNNDQLCNILIMLKNIEYNGLNNTTDNIQLGALIGIFIYNT